MLARNFKTRLCLSLEYRTHHATGRMEELSSSTLKANKQLRQRSLEPMQRLR